MKSEWNNSLVLVETVQGKVRVTVSNAEDENMKMVFAMPSELAIQFAEAMLMHAVHIEEQIENTVERMTAFE